MIQPHPSFVAFSREDVEQSIPARFEQQVSRFPERLAVRDAERSLSYHELDAVANRIAHGILARRGSTPEGIGLLLEQSALLLAAILGVLKAGKLYVPLDPSHPAAHNADLIADAGPALILTGPPVGEATRRLRMDGRLLVDLEELMAGQPATSPGLAIPAESAAYIYYTSGSTGRPKGVLDLHRNVLHNVLRYTNSLCISREDRLTLLQAPGFSGAVSSMFSALLNGAAVFPYDLRRQGMGRPLAEWLVDEQLTMYHSVPLIFRRCLVDGFRFPSLRIVRLEGDAVSKTDVLAFRAAFPPPSACTLVNGLGATETGLSRQFFVNASFPLSDGVVPLGYATADTAVAIVDASGQEAGPGVVGEITVRSKYLAVGYWRQPELTRAAFSEAPEGERVYRTGDLGRLRPDGCLEYHGRKDSQPKVRGQRVSTARVEHALLGLPAVQDAAVVIRSDPSEQPQLVAYLVAANEEGISVPAVRRALAESLPDFMIPARFVLLEALPVSANGKVDRRALPAAQELRPQLTSEYVAPRDALERQLVALWEDVLQVRPVGVHDNFFELGGDSLTAAILLPELEALTGARLFPTTLHERPRIAELVPVLRGKQAPSVRVLVPMQTRGTRTPCFFVHAHTGSVSLCIPLAKRLGPDQPFYGLQSVGLAGSEAPLASVEAIAARLIEEMRGVQPRGPYYLGGLCFGAVIAFEMAQQLIAAGEQIGLLFLADVTPEDFPALVPRASRLRFAGERVLRQARAGLAESRGARTSLRLRATAQRLNGWARGLGKVALIRWHHRRRRPLPSRLRDLSLINKAAFGRYVARTCPCAVTLVLRREDAPRYGPDVHRVWGRLAQAAPTIHYLEGRDGAMWKEPVVGTLAAQLRAGLEGTAR